MKLDEFTERNGFQEISPKGKLVSDNDDLFQDKDSQESDFSPCQDFSEEDFSSAFVGDIYEHATDCILLFFDGKSHFAGGDIPLHKVTTSERVQMVANTTISAAAQTAYDGIATANWISKKSPQEGVPGDDVRLLQSILNECSALNISKSFAGGITLLCLEFCEGVSIPYQNIEGYLMKEFGEEEEWYIEYQDSDGNVVADYNPNQEALDNAEKEEEFCLDDVIIDYGMPK